VRKSIAQPNKALQKRETPDIFTLVRRAEARAEQRVVQEG